MDGDRASYTFYDTERAGDDYHQPAFPGVWYLHHASRFDSGKTWRRPTLRRAILHVQFTASLSWRNKRDPAAQRRRICKLQLEPSCKPESLLDSRYEHHHFVVNR